MNEIWKPIEFAEGYFVSDLGRIKSIKKNRELILKLSHTKDGYVKCGITIQGSSCRFRVNRLVANAFIPNPENKPTVNHKDGNKDNNCASNLEWMTRSEQMKHAYKLGLKKPMRGTSHSMSRLTEEDVKWIRQHYKARDKECGMIALSKRFNVSCCCIKRAVKAITYSDIE